MKHDIERSRDPENTNEAIRNKLREKKKRSSGGAGFGDSARNKAVEEVAVNQVTLWYRERGWSVDSVEQEKLGFDLRCQRGKDKRHVEVKRI